MGRTPAIDWQFCQINLKFTSLTPNSWIIDAGVVVGHSDDGRSRGSIFQIFQKVLLVVNFGVVEKP
jgi:hypothetical protein